MTTLGREKRAHEFQKIWDELKLSDFPIVVEGKRDTKALRELGIVKHVIELNDGTSVLSTVERIFQNSGSSSEFIILTDWDKAGDKLAKQLISYGESCDLIPNDRIRKSLAIITAKEISCVEELPTFALGLATRTILFNTT